MRVIELEDMGDEQYKGLLKAGRVEAVFGYSHKSGRIFTPTIHFLNVHTLFGLLEPATLKEFSANIDAEDMIMQCQQILKTDEEQEADAAEAFEDRMGAEAKIQEAHFGSN